MKLIKTIEFSERENIILKSHVGRVEFIKSDKNLIEYYSNYEDIDDLNIIEDNDNIVIKEKIKDFVLNFKNLETKIKIFYNFIPKTVNINTKAGLIKLGNLYTQNKIDIDIKAGKIEGEDINSEEIMIVSKAGTIEMNRIKSEVLDIELKAGLLEIKESEVSKAYIDTKAGEVRLDNFNSKYLFEIDSKAGNSIIKKLLTSELLLDLSAGNTEINYCFFDKGDIKVNFGNVEIGMQDENIKVSGVSSFGNISVFNDNLVASGKNEKTFGMGDSKLKIKSNFGNVNIFKTKRP